MHRFFSSTPTTQSLWSRFAAFLGFLAVLSALLSPVAMLARDVQSGKLGGVCSLNNATTSNSDAQAAAGNNSPAQSKHVHCDACGTSNAAPVLLTLLVIPTFAGSDIADVFLPVDKAASVAGLPFSRGPPLLIL